jgi:hypothetical protein
VEAKPKLHNEECNDFAYHVQCYEKVLKTVLSRTTHTSQTGNLEIRG